MENKVPEDNAANAPDREVDVEHRGDMIATVEACDETATGMWSPWVQGEKHTIANPVRSELTGESADDADQNDDGLLAVFLGFSS